MGQIVVLGGGGGVAFERRGEGGKGKRESGADQGVLRADGLEEEQEEEEGGRWDLPVTAAAVHD